MIAVLFALEGLELAIPLVAGCLLASRLGISHPVLQLAAGAVTWGLLGWIAFWAYLLGPDPGLAFAIGAFAASAGWIAYLSIRDRRQVAAVMAPLLEPLLMAAAVAGLAIGLGFLYVGERDPIILAAVRFSHTLPIDHYLPLLLAQDLGSPRRPIPSPLVTGWLSSDRPPLQAGLLLLDPFRGWQSRLWYAVAGPLIQSAWLPGMWAFLKASGVGRRTRTLALAFTSVSMFTIVNTFYPWPKLLPAGFLALVAALTLGRASSDWRSPAVGLVTGAAAALAMLGHEGSAFGLGAIGLVLLLQRRLPPLRFTVAAAITFVLLLAPWTAYQHYYDPPGDRLLKLSLAGEVEITPTPPLSSIVEGYRRLGVSGTIYYKLRNLEQLAGDSPPVADLAELLHPPAGHAAALRKLIFDTRLWLFFGFLPTLQFAVLGPLLLAFAAVRRIRSPELMAARTAWEVVGVGLVAWCLLMFGPATTVPHQGTYLFELLAFAALILATVALWPRLGLAAVIAQGAATVPLVLLPPVGMRSVSPTAAALATASVVAIAGWAIWSGRAEIVPESQRHQSEAT